MKQEAIKIAATKGYPEDAANAAWEKVKENCGAEPTAAMLADYDRDAYLECKVPRPLAIAWSEAFTKGATAPVKGRKFKADKARAYSHAEVVAFIATDPKAEGLQAESARRSGDRDFLFYVNGKLDEAVSAARLEALYERDPVAPFVRIGEADVKPSAYPADAAKEDAVDVFDRPRPLGQPGNVSARLGVSLDGISEETMHAIDCAMAHDLSDAPKIALIAAAEFAKGKSAAEWLKSYPNALREWPTWKRRSLKIARPVKVTSGPFVEPAAPATRTGQTTAPLLYLAYAPADSRHARALRVHLAVALQGGAIRVWSEADIRAGQNAAAEIQRHIDEAAAIALLVSSDANADNVVARALATGKRIIPILVGKCVVDNAIGFTLPRHRGKVDGDDDWVDIVGEILKAVR